MKDDDGGKKWWWLAAFVVLGIIACLFILAISQVALVPFMVPVVSFIGKSGSSIIAWAASSAEPLLLTGGVMTMAKKCFSSIKKFYDKLPEQREKQEVVVTVKIEGLPPAAGAPVAAPPLRPIDAPIPPHVPASEPLTEKEERSLRISRRGMNVEWTKLD